MDRRFSSRLRKAIADTGLTPTEFARRAGIPQGTVSKCLNGHVPTARILVRISKATGKSVDWLLTGKEERQGEPRVAEGAAAYRSRRGEEAVWVGKLLRVLRGGSPRRKKTVKDLLDLLARQR
jgi:transcriptional regulator with XRE-family HTH domain